MLNSRMKAPARCLSPEKGHLRFGSKSFSIFMAPPPLIKELPGSFDPLHPGITL
jgi:hypothetical protein